MMTLTVEVTREDAVGHHRAAGWRLGLCPGEGDGRAAHLQRGQALRPDGRLLHLARAVALLSLLVLRYTQQGRQPVLGKDIFLINVPWYSCSFEKPRLPTLFSASLPLTFSYFISLSFFFILSLATPAPSLYLRTHLSPPHLYTPRTFFPACVLAPYQGLNFQLSWFAWEL